jgi:multidrug efflux pump subunit AcrA (membrane-fusion protein)
VLFENCSAFCEIAASSRMRPPGNASSCALGLEARESAAAASVTEPNRTFLRRKASRQDALRQKNAVAESTFDESDTDARLGEFATTQAELNFRVAQLEVTHQEELLKQRTIVSPIDGVVVERTLFAGEYTDQTNHIVTIAQINPLTPLPISTPRAGAAGSGFPTEEEVRLSDRAINLIDREMRKARGPGQTP